MFSGLHNSLGVMCEENCCDEEETKQEGGDKSITKQGVFAKANIDSSYINSQQLNSKLIKRNSIKRFSS